MWPVLHRTSVAGTICEASCEKFARRTATLFNLSQWMSLLRRFEGSWGSQKEPKRELQQVVKLHQRPSQPVPLVSPSAPLPRFFHQPSPLRHSKGRWWLPPEWAGPRYSSPWLGRPPWLITSPFGSRHPQTRWVWCNSKNAQRLICFCDAVLLLF